MLQPYLPPRSSAFTSSWLPRNATKRMERGLANQLPQLFGCDGDQLSGTLESAVIAVGGFFDGGDLVRCGPIFALRVIRGFNFHFAQGDDVRAADNTDIFAARSSSQPPTQVLLGVRDRQSLHKDSVQPPISPCQGTCPAGKRERVRGGSDRGRGRRVGHEMAVPLFRRIKGVWVEEQRRRTT